VPPTAPVDPPAVLLRLGTPGATLLVPTRVDPLAGLDRASAALLQDEAATCFAVVALGSDGDIDSALLVLDAGRRTPFATGDLDLLASIGLTLAPHTTAARHELLHRAERRRRQAAEARTQGTVRLLELLGDELAGAVVSYRGDGRCTLAVGPALRRLLRVADPIGRPMHDVLIPEPALLAALDRALAGETANALVELGSAWIDARFVAQVIDDGTVVGGVLVATDATMTTRAIDSLRSSASEAAAESEQRGQALDRLVAADEARAAALTSAVHDDVLQLLSALGWRLDALARRLEDDAATEAAGLAEQVRAASQRLGEALDDAGVGSGDEDDGDDLMELLEQAAASAGLGERIVASDALPGLVPPAVAAVLVDIATDALVNIAAHADAARVDLVARAEDGGNAVIVQDDGRGFDPARVASRARGLAVMRERARVAGGWVRVESRPGRGTTIHAWLPLR
jgi:signal transduction histidine kinase